MKKSLVAVSFLLCLVSIAVTPVRAATMIFSDGFPTTNHSVFNAGPTIGNFSVSSGCVDLYPPSSFGLTGTRSVDLDGSCWRTGTITSTEAISLSPDFLYTLTFDYSSNNNTYAFVHRAEVILGSVLDATVTGQTNFSKTFSENFTVTDVSNFHLIFKELGLSDQEGVVVGGIKISSTPLTSVPEPATWALILSGIGAAAIMRRRRA